MQLIWISGSTSQFKKINITSRGIAKLAVATSFIAIALGVMIHFLGFQVAIQYNPELARNVSGIITTEEKDAIEAHYRQHFNELQSQLANLSEHILEIKRYKEGVTELVTPFPLKNQMKGSGNKGGPYQPILFNPTTEGRLVEDLNLALNNSALLNQGIKKLEETWRDQHQWLRQLPTGSPIVNQIGLSSNYGTRIDPFTRLLAQHPGVDFSAPTGTPILAAGDGLVLRAEYDSAYGNFIEIAHADQFVSKYAHASKVHVKAGQRIQRGQLIAEVGNTGRSTGPHLHYEISHQGKMINPMQILAPQGIKVASQ
jgi:murein DD-endopeptidase MepM/ murein hydrolase activator NlpD